MKLFLSVAVATALLAGSAAAQPAVLVKSKPIHGTLPDPLEDIPSSVRRYIREESKRQFESPTTLFAMETEMIKSLGDDLNRVAKRKKLSFDEVSILVMHSVVSESATEMDQAIRERRRELQKAGALEDKDAELQNLLVRKAVLRQQIADLGPRMTPNARMLTAGK